MIRRFLLGLTNCDHWFGLMPVLRQSSAAVSPSACLVVSSLLAMSFSDLDMAQLGRNSQDVTIAIS